MKKMLIVAALIVLVIQSVVVSFVTLGLYLQNEMYRFYNDVGIAVALTFFIAVPIVIYFLVQRDHLIEMNAVLKKAEQRAKKADVAKNEFLANMSHEIRTPLNGVMGMAELLAKTKLNDKQKMFATVLKNSSTSLLMIVNDVLDFSKIESDQLKLDPAPFELAEVIENVVQLLAPQFEEKSIELVVRLASDLPGQVIGDKERFGQIIINLLRNAVKFTDAGYVLIDVSGSFVNNGSGFDLTITVEDTGIGLSEENSKQIFEKFNQVDATATRQYGGVGLGLSISSSLVKLMNGRIGVDSKLGEGSTFWLDIKFPILGDGRNKKLANFDIAGAKILIVDDNSVNRSILVEQLTEWGIMAEEASCGGRAVDMIMTAAESDRGYDLVLLDYQMPNMSGCDVAKKIRSDSRLTKLPIIMLSSVDETEGADTFTGLGIAAYLAKPVRSSRLHEQLTNALRGRPKSFAGLPEIVFENKFDEFESESRKSDEVELIDILVAEDNDVNQIVFKQILEATNWRFKIAENGGQAVEFYKQYQPKLILMDISMPILNGHDASREIRRLELEHGNVTGVPIIAVTAHSVRGDRQKCFDAGMDDYIAKPVSPEMLEKKIRHWMDEIVEREFNAEQDAQILA